MQPMEHLENIRKEKSERIKRLAKQDNKEFGDFAGMKSSFRDESHAREINAYMELSQR